MRLLGPSSAPYATEPPSTPPAYAPAPALLPLAPVVADAARIEYTDNAMYRASGDGLRNCVGLYGGYAVAAPAPLHRAQRRRSQLTPAAPLLSPPRLPSLSPVAGAGGGNTGNQGPANTYGSNTRAAGGFISASSLLPPGCCAPRPAAVYSLPALPSVAAGPPAMEVLQISPVTSAEPAFLVSPGIGEGQQRKSWNSDNFNGDDGKERPITYIGMSPTSSARGEGRDRQKLSGEPMAAGMPVRRDQQWDGFALASVHDGAGNGKARAAAAAAAPSTPPPPSSGFTYRRGAPYNIISNLP